MAEKRCSTCARMRPLEEFPVRKDRPDGRRGQCNECVNKYKRTWEARRAGKWPAVRAFDLSDVEVDLSDLDDEALDAVEDLTPSLVSFGTPMERASAESMLRLGSVEAAAADLQLTPTQLRAHLSEVQRRAATRGYSPAHDMTKTTPAGFRVKGVSTYYNRDGELVGQWVKTNAEEEQRLQKLLDAMSTIADRWQGLAEPVAPPVETTLDDDLLAVYPMGDPHIGMMSWAPETGNNFDLQIAERHLYGAVDRLVELAPPAKRALVVSVGDFFHADNRGNTTTGGTPVDSDGRWPKVLSIGIRLMRRVIDRALLKHELVDAIIEYGNHDWHTSIMLAICLSQFYENEPRVTIDTSPAKYHYYRFGQNLIGVTHGDTVKLAELGGVMACDRPIDWGETLHRYWITGHIHHDTVKELKGCTVESFRTLAPADAWHKGQGYRSGQDMKVLVFHRKWGQIVRHVVGINQITNLLGE